MNRIEKALETAAKDVLKVIESPVTLLVKAEKVIESVIKDQPLLKIAVTSVVTDGTTIAANLAGVIASRGANWVEDLALVKQIESFFTQDILAKLVPVVEQVYGELENDIHTLSAE